MFVKYERFLKKNYFIIGPPTLLALLSSFLWLWVTSNNATVFWESNVPSSLQKIGARRCVDESVFPSGQIKYVVKKRPYSSRIGFVTIWAKKVSCSHSSTEKECKVNSPIRSCWLTWWLGLCNTELVSE